MNTAVIAGASGTGFAIPEDTVSARVGSILKRCGPAHVFFLLGFLLKCTWNITKRPEDESECPARWPKGAQLVCYVLFGDMPGSIKYGCALNLVYRQLSRFGYVKRPGEKASI